MNIVILGPQGSGKGTQARLLAKEFGFFYLSSGDLLRELAQSNPDLKEKLDKGVFIEDKETFEIIKNFLEAKKIFGNIIFDGFPRSLEQYRLLKDWLAEKGTKIDLVIVLNISEKETIRRLSARRLDPTTGKIYNLITEPPGPEVDVQSLVVRDDDKEEAIRNRLGWYNSLMVPLTRQLREETKVIEVGGERSIQAISADLTKIVRGENAEN